MRKCLIFCMMIVCSTMLNAQEQAPKTKRITNIAVGLNYHYDSLLNSRLNVGLVSEVDSLRGLQVGLLYGGIRHDAHGALISGLANASHALKGVQIAGFTNLVFTPLRGLQLSAFTNTAMGMNGGLQLTGLSNITAGDTRGVQIAAYNYADTLRGTQIGLINAAAYRPKGVQIGFLNYSRDAQTRRYGLINLSPQTRVDYMLFGGTSSKINAALRFKNKTSYRILGFGTHYMGFNSEFSGDIFYRFGQYIPLSSKWTLSGDLGLYFIEIAKKKTIEGPRHLYSLQAHLNLDYQINSVVGAYISTGYGTTRYYGSHENYRSRPMIEAGITLHYDRNHEAETKWIDEKIRDYNFQMRLLEQAKSDSLFRFYDHNYTKQRWGNALAGVVGINVFVHCFDRFVLRRDFAKTTLNTTWNNFRHAFVWDNDNFKTNLFAHPYHGNLYFNSARSNGFSFWQSVPFTIGGSMMWEFFGEKEPPALNDMLATSFGGVAIGEVFHRVSALILNDRAHGTNRLFREMAATIINPMQGLKRILNGDAWRTRNKNFLYHDFSEIPVELLMSVGDRYLADNGTIFRGEHQPFVTFSLRYGDPFNQNTSSPYDYFTANIAMGFTGNQPFVHGFHLTGRLWSKLVYDGKEGQTLCGIFQHFNYYDSQPVKDGSSQTPYRISEAAAIGPGMIWRFPEIGNKNKLEQSVFADLILLGGTKSDYYSFIDRDYNMGSGYSFKSRTEMTFPYLGRLSLNLDYYRIYTWKGYENKNYTTIDPLYLNAQGDKSNAELMVVNPVLLIQMKHNWGMELSSNFYMRKTRYAYHDNVATRTFEFRAGLVYRF